MACLAPTPLRAACCCPAAPMTLEERIVANPAITATMTAESIVMGVPRGSLLFVNYWAGGRGRSTGAEDSAAVAGMPRHHYIGRIVSREIRGYELVFTMVCLNRGAPGEGTPRTFSTRAGRLDAVMLLDLGAGDRAEG